MKHIIPLVAIAAIGCGGGEPVHDGTINPTGARTSVESVSKVFDALDTSNGSSAAGAVIALTAAGQVVLTPGSARELPDAAYLPMEWPTSKTSSSFTGSADCNASGCVFNNFGDSSTSGSYRINGTIQRSGDTLSFDLTYDITAAGFDFHWEMDGRVTVTETRIDGYVNSNGDANVSQDGRSYNVSWDIDIDYNDIGLVDGCPVSGSLSAEVGYSVSGAQSGSYRAAASVRFGPACGQFSAN
jgi:hypothetical protein